MARIIDKHFRRLASKYLDSKLVFAMDVFLSVAVSALILLIAISFKASYFVPHTLFSVTWIISSIVASIVMFRVMRTYTIIIRHTSFKDLLKFSIAAAGKVLIMTAALMVFSTVDWAVVQMLCVDLAFTFVLVVAVRLVMIAAYDLYKARVRDLQKCKRVLVYGTSDKSESAILRFSNSPHYNPIGVITPNESLKGSRFADRQVYVFKSEEDVERVTLDLSCSAVLFTKRSDARAEGDRLVKYCSDMGVKVLIVPEVGELEEERNAVIREVKVEDLLGRDEIRISISEIKKGFAGRTVMVTGAAGSIGSELCRQLASFGVGRLILFDNAETPMHNLRLELEEVYPELDFVPVIGDVRSINRLDFAFRNYKPEVVFHAAAYKHVPLMEENPCEAVQVNVVGTRHVADKCIEYGIEKMVMISTDKAVNPTNIMGCSKRLAEIYVQSLGLAIESGKLPGSTQFVTTRFGNVLGSNGSVIPRFREQIEKGGPVTVTHPEITRFFMTIPEACRLVMEAVIMDTANRICVFDMGEPVKIDTLARRMIQLSGLVEGKDIKIEYSGLRPGEKLYEEVLSNVENTEQTSHERIRIAKVRTYEYADALESVESLNALSRDVKIPEMVKLMKQIVPEFISKNSKFSEYDAK
ncbi:MAG: polysaccharide biosynthesis protein [Bacteroidales bacterium]|nr:polysaccharide biosynthesis protein [Bacteroidales bacterium]